MTRLPAALILHASGTNRDLDVAQAFETAGALPEIVHINALRRGEKRWSDYQILVIPGGFSYGDALGAGRLLALDLRTYAAAEIEAFVQAGKPVIGICNGFQALVKAGILPGALNPAEPTQTTATLTFNRQGSFECRWVYLKSVSTRCLWTPQVDTLIYCPVAHGEGNFTAASPGVIASLQASQQVALLYVTADGQPANGAYPANPNGSSADIAGICNPAGNVLGLMPHPENAIFPYQHPRWTRHEAGHGGLSLFKAGVDYAAQM